MVKQNGYRALERIEEATHLKIVIKEAEWSIRIKKQHRGVPYMH